PTPCPPPPQLYTLSLHDALPIYNPRCPSPATPARTRAPLRPSGGRGRGPSLSDGREPLQLNLGGKPLQRLSVADGFVVEGLAGSDRKSTRLNSSHRTISYAVFCL